MENVLFTNETQTEKVITFGAERSVKQKKHRLITGMFCLVLIIGIVMIIVIPWKYTFLAVLFALLVLVGSAVLFAKATDTRVETGTPPVIRTGETENYRYEFTEQGFKVSGPVEKTVAWTDITLIRNIGVGYQIKCGQDHFTIKKQGFEGGSDKDFRALLQSKGITVK
ncbi:MAG: hypothetical protein IKN17_08640 [Ruminococcus sp.]|nr:hypothetical protein [Ruminococcus sp.]